MATMMIPQGARGLKSTVHTVGLLAMALLLPPVTGAATAPDKAQVKVSASDEQCFTCHSISGLRKTTGDGERISLHIAKEEYAGSLHAVIGCRGCHRDVDPDQHPVMRSIATARALTLQATAACRNCHANKYEQYEGSIHASLAAKGNSAAPVCANCHEPHSVRPVSTFDLASGQPCRTCHEDIFEAYAGSVHGRARVGAGQAQAPFCTDCHRAHEVQAVAAGDQLKQACLSCHEGALLAHDKWLPNAGRHLESVACPACHSPMAERSVDLRLYDSKSQQLVAEDPGFAERLAAIDTAGDGLDPLELWALVSETNDVHEGARLTLRGRLEVSNGAQAHRLAFKQEAVRECDTCHRLGAETYDSVTVSVSDADGRRIRYAAGQETLTSAVSVGSVGDFYTVGGTRIGLLDALLVLAILAGLGIPVTHWTLRRLSRKKR
jgi:hypothetical protein